MNRDLREIFALMIWETGAYARALRLDGWPISETPQHEQAEVMFWLLGLYARHGPDWRIVAGERIARIMERWARACAGGPGELSTNPCFGPSGEAPNETRSKPPGSRIIPIEVLPFFTRSPTS